MHLFCLERQMYLPGTAEFAEALENPSGDLLNAAIRIEAETDLAMPDKANRNRDPEFASAGLGPRGIQHTGAQDTKLEFADATLHSQKQTVIRTTRIVDAIEVDHARIDQAAQLQQMMPVPTIAGETGGVEAKHGADLAGAEPSDQLLEARTCHGAAGGSAEIVVDDIDIVKSMAAGFLNEIILAALALEMDLHLGLCGLAHIHDRLAAQNCWRQGISVRHRRSPWDPCRRLPSAGGPDAERRRCGRRTSSRSTRDGPATSPAGGTAWAKQSD